VEVGHDLLKLRLIGLYPPSSFVPHSSLPA